MEPLKNWKLLTPCEETKLLSDKVQYAEASRWEVIKLKQHLSNCKACTNYSNKNTKLSELCNKATLQRLSGSDKEKMKKKMDSLL